MIALHTAEQLKEHLRNIARWLIMVPVIVLLLFGCGQIATLQRTALMETNLASNLKAIYLPWDYVIVAPVSARVLEELQEEEQLPEEIIVTGTFWPDQTEPPDSTPLALEPSTTPSPSPTETATASSTAEPIPTSTPSPPVLSPTASLTTAPTRTATYIYYTLTPTRTPTRTSTQTSTSTPTRTSTQTSTSTPTRTPTASVTLTPSISPSTTISPSPSPTRTRTASNTPTRTSTITPIGMLTRTPTQTRTVTPTATQSRTATLTLIPTWTRTITPTRTPTRTPTSSITSTPTPGFTLTPSPTFTPSQTLTPSNTSTRTSTLTPTLTPTFQSILPILEGTPQQGPGGSCTSHWGYFNPNPYRVKILVGSENYFAPPPQDRGQALEFLPGRQVDIFSVSWGEDKDGYPLTWYLTGIGETAGWCWPPTPTPTFTPTPTPTQTPELCGGTIPPGEPDIGLPDNIFAAIPCNTYITVDLIAQGYSPVDTTLPDPDFDLVYYERIAPGFTDRINFDWTILQVGTGPSGACLAGDWFDALVWGDDDITNNGHLGGLIFPEVDNATVFLVDLFGTLPYQTGIAIDLDALGLSGIYPCLQVFSPINWPDNDAAEVDALQILP